MQDRDLRLEFKDRVGKGRIEWVENELGEKFRKVYLLRERKEPNQEGSGYRYKTMCMRQYLRDIENSQHRKVFTKILAGDHPLAVERLRWVDNHRVQVPYEERMCRFCREKVETPEHALLQCSHPPALELRRRYLQEYQLLTGKHLDDDSDLTGFLVGMFNCRPAYQKTAKFMYDTIKIFDAVALYVPQ
ncbi:hypothetical protein V5O48_019396, partial [Marasmius crinis-equi]